MDEDELKLCLMRAVRQYFKRTKHFVIFADAAVFPLGEQRRDQHLHHRVMVESDHEACLQCSEGRTLQDGEDECTHVSRYHVQDGEDGSSTQVSQYHTVSAM